MTIARDMALDEHAAIRDHVDAAIFADSVRHHLKPAPEPYLAVARRLDVGVADVRLVAAHSWDVSGALATGCKAQAQAPARPPYGCSNGSWTTSPPRPHLLEGAVEIGS